jgi:hypothetical protein
MLPAAVHYAAGRALAEAGSRYLLELIAFCDLSQSAAVAYERNAASEWFSANKKHMSAVNTAEIGRLLDETVRTLQEVGVALS